MPTDGFVGFNLAKVRKLARDLEDASQAAAPLHREIAGLLEDVDGALDDGKQAAHSAELRQVQRAGPRIGVTSAAAPLTSGLLSGLPGSLRSELHSLSVDMKHRVTLAEAAEQKKPGLKGVSPAEAFNDNGKPTPSCENPDAGQDHDKSGWDKLTDSLGDAWDQTTEDLGDAWDKTTDLAGDAANFIDHTFTPETLAAAAETTLGAFLTVVGTGGEIGGVALDATGAGALLGIPLNVVSAGAIAAGGGMTAKGLNDLWSAARNRDPGPYDRKGNQHGPPQKPPKARKKHDLTEEERDGGHALEKHVGHSNEQISGRAQGMKESDDAASTYETKEEADKATKEAIEQNKGDINDWLKKANPGATKEFESEKLESPTGRRVTKQESMDGEEPKNVYGAKVVLKVNEEGEYYVLTSYPVPGKEPAPIPDPPPPAPSIPQPRYPYNTVFGPFGP